MISMRHIQFVKLNVNDTIINNEYHKNIWKELQLNYYERPI